MEVGRDAMQDLRLLNDGGTMAGTDCASQLSEARPSPQLMDFYVSRESGRVGECVSVSVSVVEKHM